MKILLNVALLIFLMVLVHSCKEKPQVMTMTPSNTTFSGTTLSGKVLKEGSSSVIKFGFVYGNKNNPETTGTFVEGDGSQSDFSFNLTGLPPASKYYVKAFAANSDKDGYGNVCSFTTLGLPAIWTKSISFDPLLWPNNIVAIDENNYWMSLCPIVDLNPRPNIPIHILHTSDGGLTWTDAIIPDSQRKAAAQLAAISKTTAWINVSGLGLFKTTDGGNTWNLINQTSEFLTHILGLHFFDQNEGIAKYLIDNPGIANDSMIILKTYNGGTSWSKVQFYSQVSRIVGESSWYAGKGPMEAIGDTVAFATDCGRIFMSYNRGITWNAVSYGSSPYETFISLALISSKKYSLVSIGKTDFNGGEYHFNRYPLAKVFATENGGNIWSAPFQLNIIQGLINTVPGQKSLYVVNGIFYDNNGGTYLSKDAGRTFFAADSLYTSMAAVGFASINSGIGATLNYNQNSANPPQNFIYIWSPERLFRKNIIPR